MKKASIYIMLLIVCCSSITLKASNDLQTISNSPINSSINEKAHAEALITRLKAIRKMDKSALDSIEKKQLRSEVKVIDQELRHIRYGVYLSVGAIIIIILLLIILF